jgi:hypothetical protein
MQVLELEVARAAFIRLHDVRAVELVNRTASGLASGTPKGLLLADIAAWQGKFNEAAKLFVSEGQLEKVCAGLQSPCIRSYTRLPCMVYCWHASQSSIVHAAEYLVRP